MNLDERLTEAFDRGHRLGVGALSDEERDLYRVQYFILEFEMGGLSGYLYNQLCRIEDVDRTVAAMRRLGFDRLAGMVEEAVGLFRGYRASDELGTWGDVMRAYDPGERVSSIDREIGGLKNYR